MWHYRSPLDEVTCESLPANGALRFLGGGGDRNILVVELKGYLVLLVVDLGALVIAPFLTEDNVICTEVSDGEP